MSREKQGLVKDPEGDELNDSPHKIKKYTQPDNEDIMGQSPNFPQQEVSPMRQEPPFKLDMTYSQKKRARANSFSQAIDHSGSPSKDELTPFELSGLNLAQAPVGSIYKINNMVRKPIVYRN